MINVPPVFACLIPVTLFFGPEGVWAQGGSLALFVEKELTEKTYSLKCRADRIFRSFAIHLREC